MSCHDCKNFKKSEKYISEKAGTFFPAPGTGIITGPGWPAR